jgi:hypothetical protein
MQASIKSLDDATAIRVLRVFSTARGRHGDYQTEWSSDLRQALAEGIEDANVAAAASEGDLAREALLVLAADPENQGPLTALVGSRAPERFMDAETVAIGVAALIALQTYVKFERTKDGRIYFKIEKKPLPLALMKKLIYFFTDHPTGEL